MEVRGKRLAGGSEVAKRARSIRMEKTITKAISSKSLKQLFHQ